MASCKICHQSRSFERQPVVGLAVKVKLFCEDRVNNSSSYVNSFKVVDDIDGAKESYDLNLRL